MLECQKFSNNLNKLQVLFIASIVISKCLNLGRKFSSLKLSQKNHRQFAGAKVCLSFLIKNRVELSKRSAVSSNNLLKV